MNAACENSPVTLVVTEVKDHLWGWVGPMPMWHFPHCEATAARCSWEIALPLPRMCLSKAPLTEVAQGRVLPGKQKIPGPSELVRDQLVSATRTVWSRDPRNPPRFQCVGTKNRNWESAFGNFSGKSTWPQHKILCLLKSNHKKYELVCCKSVGIFPL